MTTKSDSKISTEKRVKYLKSKLGQFYDIMNMKADQKIDEWTRRNVINREITIEEYIWNEIRTIDFDMFKKQSEMAKKAKQGQQPPQNNRPQMR